MPAKLKTTLSERDLSLDNKSLLLYNIGRLTSV